MCTSIYFRFPQRYLVSQTAEKKNARESPSRKYFPSSHNPETDDVWIGEEECGSGLSKQRQTIDRHLHTRHHSEWHISSSESKQAGRQTQVYCWEKSNLWVWFSHRSDSVIMRRRGEIQELVAVCTASAPPRSGRSPVDGEQPALWIIKVRRDRRG